MNTTLLWNNGGLLFGLQHNAPASLVHFVTYRTKWTRDASALRWRPERRPPLFRSRVMFLSFSHPYLVSVLFTGPSLLKMKFCTKFSPQFLFFFGGFIANFQMKLYPWNLISHCTRTCLWLATNAFCAGDKHFWHWRWTHFELEINPLSAGDKLFEHSNFSHTHTTSYQRLPKRFISRWLLVTATHLWKWTISRCRDAKDI